MTMRMKKLFSILAVAATVLLTACDEHQDFPDTAMKVTHILTTDGKVMPYETYEQSCKQAIAGVMLAIKQMTTSKVCTSQFLTPNSSFLILIIPPPTVYG